MTVAADLARAMQEAGVDAPSRWLEVVASTNSEALAWAEAGASDFSLVCAGHQTAGRGRLGRTWENLPGRALLFSLVLRPGGEVERASLLTLLAGAAIAEAAAEVTGLEVRCKWPNDLTLAGEKAGGILAESRVDDGVLTHLVLGVGVNIDAPPSVAHATGLGESADPMRLLASFLRRFRRGYVLADPSFATGALERWRAVSATLGKQVEARLADGRTIRGRAVDVDDSGALILEGAGGPTVVRSGEVVHLR